MVKRMGKFDKLATRILTGGSDANISFQDLCVLLKRLGFSENIRGSHHIYRKEKIDEKINLQKTGSKAKPYQVKQVRAVIVKYALLGE